MSRRSLCGLVLSVLCLVLPSLAGAAITSVSFPTPVFRPAETVPVQSSQAEIRLDLDATAGQYRLDVFRATTTDLVATTLVVHAGPQGTPLRHTVAVPLQEGGNRFYLRVTDRTTEASTAQVTSGDTPVITRDMKTRIYSATLDALRPYERTTLQSTAEVDYTINGTASRYQVEVMSLAGTLMTVTTGAGSGTVTAIPLSSGENNLYLRVTAVDTFSDPTPVLSNIATVVYDTAVPVINNLQVAFPLLPTGSAAVGIQGDTEAYSLVTIRSSTGDVYSERANDLGYFSILGVGLGFEPPGPTTTTFTVTATDLAGRVSAPSTLTADRLDADPRFDYVLQSPPDGWVLLPDEPVHIQGSVGDILGPFQVRFYARSGSGLPLLEEILDDLEPGTAFEKDIALVGDPVTPDQDVVWSIEAEVQSTAGVTERHFLGEVTIDVADPPAPLFSDARLDDVLFTNAPSLTVEGSAERWSTIFFSNWLGVTYRPGSKLYTEATNAAAGAEFRSTMTLAALPEQRFSLEVTTVATSTRTGPVSKREIIIERDVTAPQVRLLTVDGEPEGTGRQRFHRAGELVTFRLTVSEPMPVEPELWVTERGSEALPAPLTAVVAPGLIFEYGYAVQPSGGFDGNVDLVVTGGVDRAGNILEPEYRAERVLVVDTLAPVVSPTGTFPADGSVISVRPDPLIVVLREHPLSAVPASGVDIEASSLEVLGPFEVDPTRRQTGTLTRYAPDTLEFHFGAGQFVDEGTYHVLVHGVDRAGNTTTETVVLRLDTTPISELFIETVTPAAEANVNELTMPRNPSGRQYVSVDFSQAVTPELDLARSTLRVDNLCPVPWRVPGTLTTTGTATLTFTFDRNFPVDGSRDGVYTIRVAPRDRAGNLAPEEAYNFVYDTVEPFVLDGWNSLPDFGITTAATIFPAAKSVVRGPLRHVSATMVDGVATAGGNEFTGSGIDTSLTSGSDIELVLVDRHPLTALAVGDSTTNTAALTSTLKFVSVQPPVYSPCWPGARQATAMRELGVDPLSGAPLGLAVGGTHDGEWELRIRPRDRSGNRGVTAYSRFTYDTVPPSGTLSIITNEERVTGSTLVTTGTAWDNDKTTHDAGQGVAAVQIRLEAVDGGGGTVAPALIDWSPATLPVNLHLLPAETVVSWSFTGRIPAYKGRGRLLVRILDRAGNETLVVRDLDIQSNPLDAPTLVSPKNNAAVPGAVVPFTWTRVEGASAYRVALRDPAGNVILRLVDFPFDTVSVNLANQQPGWWTWTVSAVDTAGTPGTPAQAWRFLLDASAPVVVAVRPYDAVLPGAQGGSVLGGQVRLAVTFSEAMDVTTAPVVTFRPADPTVGTTLVLQVSYVDREWRGVVDVPPGPGEPDWNGMGTVWVEGARDLAGNEAPAFTAPFEVDLGPWFEVKAFANPVLKREAVFHVRCHAHSGGPLENLAGNPYMEVQQAGAPRQVVALTPFQPSVYRGVYVIDRNFTGDAVLLISGTDLRGNTSKRRLTFSVATIIAADRFHQAFGSFLTVSLEARSVSADTALTILPADTDPTTDPTPAGGELKVVRRLQRVLEGAVDLAKSGTARTSLADLRLRGDVLPPGRVALVLRRGDRWVFQPGVERSGVLVSSVAGLGDFALAVDETPPKVEPLDGVTDEGALVARRRLRLTLSDGGVGVNPESILAAVDGGPVEARYDEATSTLEVDLPVLKAGTAALDLRASDRLGNEIRWTSALATAAPLSVTSFVGAPNPCRGPATFAWRQADGSGPGTLRIYDAAGALVRSLDVPGAGAGYARRLWDGLDKRGRAVSSGVYLVRLRLPSLDGGAVTATTKLAVLR